MLKDGVWEEPRWDTMTICGKGEIVKPMWIKLNLMISDSEEYSVTFVTKSFLNI